MKGRVENQNDRTYLLKVRERVMEQLRYLDAAPSIQMQEIPPDIQGFLDGEEEQRDAEEDSEIGKDTRSFRRKSIIHENEWYSDEDDNDGSDDGWNGMNIDDDD